MPQPPQVNRTFHGTAAVRNYQQTLDWLARFVGCVALEFSDAPPPIARIGGCCWLGDNLLELAEPNAPDTPTAKFLERFGPGYLNLALQLDDLRIADQWLTEHGAKPSLCPENHFTFTRSSDTCGLQFEWADFKNLDWDPREGGSIPPRPQALIDAPRIGNWGALVNDPCAALARLTELWAAPVLFENYNAPPSEPAAALALPDGVLTLYRLPKDPQQEWRLWARRVGKPRFHLMTFRVRDLASAAHRFAEENVRILRGSAGAGLIVTHPDDTTGLCMAWTDRDVPGDPRGLLGG